jgi:hypothetical protein
MEGNGRGIGSTNPAFPEGFEENHESLLRRVDVPVGAQTGHLSNKIISVIALAKCLMSSHFSSISVAPTWSTGHPSASFHFSFLI